MAYSNTGGSISSTGYQLGIFLVKAHYTVRGRRAVPLSALLKVRMMNARELELLEAALEQVKREQE